MRDSPYPLKLQGYKTPPQQISGCPLPLLRPFSIGQGLTPPPKPDRCPVPFLPLYLPLWQLHTGPGPEGVQGQIGPLAMYPHGSSWSVILSNTSLICPGSPGAEVRNPELRGGPRPHQDKWAGGLQIRFHRATVRWHRPTVLVQLP